MGLFNLSLILSGMSSILSQINVGPRKLDNGTASDFACVDNAHSTENCLSPSREMLFYNNMSIPIDIYEQLYNRSFHLLAESVYPQEKIYMPLYDLGTSISIVATVPKLEEIIYHNVAIFSTDTQYVFNVHNPMVTSPNVEVILNHSSVDRSHSMHPWIRPMNTPVATCMSAKFRSLSVKPIDMFWDDGADGVFSGQLKLGLEMTTNTYEGHVFYFTEQTTRNQAVRKEISRFTMEKGQTTYIIRNPEDDINRIPEELQVQTELEEAFKKKYRNITGIEYIHYFGRDSVTAKGVLPVDKVLPRSPPGLFMYPTDYIGQKHRVVTPETKWTCDGDAQDCHNPIGEPLVLDLEVISQTPRAFYIENFLSDVEAEHIISKSKDKIKQSGVGDPATGVFNSNTRTSKNTWLRRQFSPMVNSIFKRASDLLQLDDRRLYPERTVAEDENGEKLHHIVEELQVVHYGVGEKYDTHHDWGVNGYPESRFLTLLLYLTDQVDENAGGETSFPKAANGTGIKILPKKGSAALFYSVLPDGNGDDLSAHASMPVHRGEKWLANMWVWDSSRR